MAIEVGPARSRRAILAGAVGGAIALAAQALGRPMPARAGDDGDVVLGAANTTDKPTRITSTGYGSAFRADGGSMSALWGECTGGAGAVGISKTNAGVHGATYAANRPGVQGVALDSGTGVFGRSGGYEDILTPMKTGVFGYADQDDTAAGVLGQSFTGRGVLGSATSGRGVEGVAGAGYGVYGHTTSGRGVFGTATSGSGVRGYATKGTAGHFSSADPMIGFALRAVGRVKLDKCAGIATIADGARTVLVDPGIDLTPTSVVVATLRSPAGGTIAVQRVAVDTTANTFTIWLTASATVAASVSWIVLN